MLNVDVGTPWEISEIPFGAWRWRFGDLAEGRERCCCAAYPAAPGGVTCAQRSRCLANWTESERARAGLLCLLAAMNAASVRPLSFGRLQT